MRIPKLICKSFCVLTYTHFIISLCSSPTSTANDG